MAGRKTRRRRRRTQATAKGFAFYANAKIDSFILERNIYNKNKSGSVPLKVCT